MKLNYQSICNNLLKELSPRSRDILEKRFGLKSGEKRTLESVGKEYGITRERVRQIEKEGLGRARKVAKVNCKTLFQYFKEEIQTLGSLEKEDSLISELGSSSKILGGKTDKGRNQILFLLALDTQFQKLKETEDFYSFWTIDLSSFALAKKISGDFIKTLHKRNQPLTSEQYIQDENKNSRTKNLISKLFPKALFSYLEISKGILRNTEGKYGFPDWPEINPKGIKDKAYLALKKENKPLHFSKVAEIIEGPTHLQTVHNELIKDPRFVLVGRGIYGLQEWGYKSGTVQEVIFSILKEAHRPLTKPEIVNDVLKQRFVKKNTIILNLNNKKYFWRNSQGRYRPRLI